MGSYDLTMDVERVAWLVNQIVDRLHDQSKVVSEETLAMGEALWSEVGEDAEDIPAGAAMALGYLHYLRFVHLPFESDTPDLEAAMMFFSRADDDVPRRIRVLLDEQAAINHDLDRWMGRAAETMVVARRTGDREKADLAIDMMRRARAWNKSETEGRAAVQTFLAVALSARFKICGDPADIDRAVAAARKATAEINSRANLAAALGARYTLTGVEADLVEAIEIGREVIADCAEDDEEFGRYLSNHGGNLVDLYRRRGDRSLLEEAIATSRHAVRIGTDHQLRLAQLNLAAGLRVRYQAYRLPADMREAVELARVAIRTWPQSDPEKLRSIANLIDLLVQHGEAAEALELGDQVLAGPVLAEVERPMIVVNIARALSALGRDPERVALLEDEAVATLNRAHPRWALVAANRAHSLVEGGQDLDRAAELAQEAVKATPSDDPALAWRLQIVALTCQAIADRDNSVVAREAAWQAWQRSSSLPVGPTYTRLQSALLGALWSRSALNDRQRTLGGYVAATALLDKLAWRGLGRADLERLLATFAELAGDAPAAALAADDIDLAVRLSEQARGVLWSQRLATDSVSAMLQAVAPDTAAQLVEVAQRLDALTSLASGTAQASTGGLD